MRNFLTSWETAGFSRRNLLHGVSMISLQNCAGYKGKPRNIVPMKMIVTLGRARPSAGNIKGRDSSAVRLATVRVTEPSLQQQQSKARHYQLHRAWTDRHRACKASFTRSGFRPAGRQHNLQLCNISGSNRPVERPRTLWLAVVHAQWSAMDRNTITALYLLYRRRKRRRNRLRWVKKKKTERRHSAPFKHNLVNYEMTQTGFFYYFRMAVSSFDEMHRRLKESSAS
jgi:hypothetical protein